jgi:hypothetical protein
VHLLCNSANSCLVCDPTFYLPLCIWTTSNYCDSEYAITVSTRALHWSLFRARLIQSTPSHPISLKSILILSTHLHLGLPSCIFPSGFPTNILYAFLVSHIHATCPAHLILLGLIILIMIRKEWKLWSSFLHSLSKIAKAKRGNSYQTFEITVI